MRRALPEFARFLVAGAVNTGISAFIDGNGRVLATLPKLQENILARTVPLDDRVSLYSTWGDWVGLACLAATFGLLPLAWLQSRQGRRPAAV